MMSEIKNRNYLIEGYLNRLKENRDNGLIDQTFSKCGEHFILFHFLNFAMYAEALKAIDEMEDQGLLRHKAKAWWKESERCWNRYQRQMRKAIADDAWFLLQDYLVLAHEQLEPYFGVLKGCIIDVFKKENASRKYDIASQMLVSYKIGEIASILWPRYFDIYREMCGVDFSMHFKFAKMDVIMINVKNIAQEFIKANFSIRDLFEEKGVNEACAAIETKIADTDMFDDAACKAINYSPSIREQYKAFLEKEEDVLHV